MVCQCSVELTIPITIAGGAVSSRGNSWRIADKSVGISWPEEGHNIHTSVSKYCDSYNLPFVA